MLVGYLILLQCLVVCICRSVMGFLLRLVACLVVVGFLACDVAGQWSMSSLKHRGLLPPQLLQRQPTVPLPPALPEKCQLDDDEKIRCGVPDVTAEQCDALDCCYDKQQCYYGKAVTVQCTRDGQFVIVIAKATTQPPIDVDSISLMETTDASCSPADTTSTFVIFQFPVTACGTITKEEKGFVVYENYMSSSYDIGVGPRGAITRDTLFELLFQCKYSGNSVETLVVEVNDVPPPLPVAAVGPLRVELRLANGKCFTKGCVEANVAYSSYYADADYPVKKVLREPVYAEVRILDRSDPNLVLTLEQCWATAMPSPDSLPQWALVVDGCPYEDDRYLTTMVPVDGSSGLPYPSHYKRFILEMFTFVDQQSYSPMRDTVYIHCATAVCYPSSTTLCEKPCNRQRRDVAAVKLTSGQRALVSSREVIFAEPLYGRKWDASVPEKLKS